MVRRRGRCGVAQQPQQEQAAPSKPPLLKGSHLDSRAWLALQVAPGLTACSRPSRAPHEETARTGVRVLR